MIAFNNELIVFLFLEIIVFSLQFVAFFMSLYILRYWDHASSSATQYRLEKRSYLVILAIFFTLSFKIILLPFFAFVIDRLSLLIPGAMCGAGVIDANAFGMPLLLLKIVLVFMMGMWLLLNHSDIRAKEYPFFRQKLWLFVIIFFLGCVELGLDLLYIANLSTEQPVACCSTIYGISGTQNPLPFDLDISRTLMLFYLIYVLTLVSAFYRYSLVSLFANIFFFYIAYVAVVHFFSTYVYQLPTHKCPFCMLQKEYWYAGYFIWGSLFVGVFFAVAGALLRLVTGMAYTKAYRLNVIFNTLFVSLCSLYVLFYYLKTGVLLT